MSNEQSIALRKQAMEALQESTTMLKVARNLLEQGNRKEAVRLQEGARAKCNVSVWLVAQANTLEDASPRHIPPRHSVSSSMTHKTLTYSPRLGGVTQIRVE